MATIAEHLVISLGLDPRPLQSGLNQVKSMAMRWAGPIAGAFSISKMFQSYVQSVSWVAKVTGAYFQKYEDYRYKMAMLSRVTREDIQLYRQYREGLMRFNIAMGDLSMKIVREFYPAFRIALDLLNKFSTWVSGNHDNIIRFLKVTAAVIGTVLIPTILRLTAALLANPLTWFIALLLAVILVIDDFVTYVQGGKSELEELWRAFGTPEELRARFQGIIDFLKGLKDSGPLIGTIGMIVLGIMSIGGAVLATARAFSALKSAGSALFAVVRPLFRFLMAHPFLWLATAAYALYQNWEGVKEGAEALWNDISNKLAEWGDKLLQYYTKAGKWVSDYVETCKGFYKGLYESLKNWASDYWDSIKQGFIDLITDMANIWNNSWIGQKFNAIVQGASDLYNDLLGDNPPPGTTKENAAATQKAISKWHTGIDEGLASFYGLSPITPEAMGTGAGAGSMTQNNTSSVNNSGNNITVNINAPTGEEGVNEFKDTLTDLFPIDDANTGTRQ